MSASPVVELFHRCARSQDDRAWESFVDCFGPRIRHGVHRALRRLEEICGPEDVEDLVQDVYRRLLERVRRGRSSFRGETEGEVKRYLQRVCDSAVLDLSRSRRAAKRRAYIRVLASANVERIVDRAATPEAACLRREARAELVRSCREVVSGPERERDLAIFKLAILDGWTSREIAEGCDFGLKTGSIDSVLSRQRRRLEERGVSVPRRS